ncbi:esterase-like activity of phytase family protein [Glutamicibacter sp. NPDC087344]|uniref:esterase-like activity of phytase family protein n=1 Tax=Glutamicibacter sp. NPDC087344 TaxID=3363994 RepID=UPI0037F8BB49
MKRTAKKSAGIIAALALGAGGLAPLTLAAAASADTGSYFERTATYPVYLNHPEGAAAQTAAEISTVSEDGKTLIYTDALSRRIGFVDISDASKPTGLGTLPLHQLGSAEDEPTSVAAYGEYVLVVVNTSQSYTAPSGRVDLVRIADRTLVHSIDLTGQPDSIALSADGAYAAIAIENERDEDAGDGGLPQAPAGSVAILDLLGESPDQWNLREVPLTGGTKDEPVALDQLVQAGLDTPQDPEPEYVTINSQNQVAVTLQENNGIVLIDLPTGEITSAFSAGSVDLDGIDTEDDGKLDPTGSLQDVPREPDAIGWIQDRYLATANEGDWKGGSRGFTIFDSQTGKPVWDAGNSFENLALSQGLFPEARAGKKGTEPEGLAVHEYHGVEYAFVASERGNFVAVYDLSDPLAPKYVQTLPTTNGPEGILPIPGRDLLAVSSETDEAENGVRSALTLFSFGAAQAQFPQLSSDPSNPVPFGALSGLSADLENPGRIFAVSDNAYEPLIYTIDAEQGLVEDSLPVTEDGAPADLDLEGLSAREDGGFWAANEGADAAGNALVRIDADGAVAQRVQLPQEVIGQLKGQGLEGVTAYGSGDAEQVVFTLQREVPGEDFVRIGRYTTATEEFAWFGYTLQDAGDDGSWNGLSEITRLSDGSYAVIERDKRIGEDAQLKAIYQFELPETSGTGSADGPVTMVEKKLAVDVLPVLEQTNGRTQEKLEGLTVAGNGQVYVVTDNDAVKDASGETVFANLGAEAEVFELAPAASATPTPSLEPSASPSDEASAEPSATPSATASADPSESDAPTQAPAESEPADPPQSQSPEAGADPDDLAQTGFSALWFLPLGLIVAGLGVAAALKARSSVRQH